MTITATANLVLIPFPGMGHLVPAVELAKQLVARDSRLSITVLIIKLSMKEDKDESYILSLKSDNSHINRGIEFVDIPLIDVVEFDLTFATPALYMEAYKSKVKEVVERLRDSTHAPIAGLLVDMFCTTMVDVAIELGLPSYIFFTSGACHLRSMLHFQGQGIDVSREYDVVQSPDTTLEIPGFRNHVPVSALPGKLLNKDRSSADFLRHAEKYRLSNGIIVNTFTELEQGFIDSMSEEKGISPVYPVGPILNLATYNDDDDKSSSTKDPTMRWLDAQPSHSVVFLCFGSRGSFNDMQVKEIAIGLERSGHRFLWSLRQRPDNQGVGLEPPSELDDFSSVLPEEFLERTVNQGRVIGWAPQSKVLAHGAVRMFVSHCGWNSILESLWYGVPIAAWPISAEQQFNAFALVRELEIATEIKIDYRQDFGINIVVRAEEVEDGIRKAMEEPSTSRITSDLRKKVNEMSEKARKTNGKNGSSYESLGRFMDDIFLNMP